MTKDWHHVEFRTEQPAPTERGYFYAKRRGEDLEVKPVYVCSHVGNLVAWSCGTASHESLHRFQWFGPVTMVQESKPE